MPSAAVMCFSILQSAAGSAASNLISCLLNASNQCSCLSSPPPDASTGCVSNSSSGGGGNGSCTSNYSETCGSTSYSVVCSCPQAKCVCFGDTTTVIDYPDCPYCNTFGSGGPGLTESELYSLCKFPQ
jgi:hypothetical protein